MRAALYTLLARLRAFVRPGAADADFDEELAAHLAMAEEENVRRGMSPDDARREARLALGGVTQLRESARGARGLPWLETFWLDGKLGLRRLRRSWGLTVVGGLAMAVTIGLGASIFTTWNAIAGTRLPLDDDERIVAMQSFDRAAQLVHRDTPLADFRRWRQTMTSVEQVSAMRAISPRVGPPDSAPTPVPAAETTASAFQLARVQPLRGRPLLESDERAGAPPVAVIGEALWRSMYSARPSAIGQRILIDGVPHVIVGVMPDAFRLPSHQRLWVPLQVDPAAESRPGSDVFVFARLVPGAALERAQAELSRLGMLPEARIGDRTSHIDTRVVPYAAGFFPGLPDNPWISGVIFSLAALLLVPPCANIAILVYARTLTRRDEFVARTALGAGRSRIVMQVFIEQLVLAAAAGIIGLFFARRFSERLLAIVVPGMGPENLPFWVDFSPSVSTVLCAASLTIVAAAIAGAAPAFHATSRWYRSGSLALGSRGTARLGHAWTLLLAMQVGLTLAVLPAASEMLWGIYRPVFAGPRLPVQDFLTASLAMEGDTSRFDILRREAATELRSEAGIAGVTASASPLMQEPEANIEVEGRDGSDEQVRFNLIDDRYFEVFGARLLAGRLFTAGDFQPGATPVVVNRSFVTEVLGEGNPLGRRFHYRDSAATREAAPPDGSHEVVGVVEDFPGSNDGPILFHPMSAPRRMVALTVRAPASMGAAAARLQAGVARVDPRLRLGRVQSLEEIYWQRQSVSQTFGFILGSVMLAVVLLSMAGIYTLTTFVVAQRWREIGVRSALGAQPWRLVGGIFGRAVMPLLIGAAAGCALAIGILGMLPITEAGGETIPAIVPLSAALMIAIGVLAVAGPARRAIRIDLLEALRVS